MVQSITKRTKYKEQKQKQRKTKFRSLSSFSLHSLSLRASTSFVSKQSRLHENGLPAENGTVTYACRGLLDLKHIYYIYIYICSEKYKKKQIGKTGRIIGRRREISQNTKPIEIRHNTTRNQIKQDKTNPNQNQTNPNQTKPILNHAKPNKIHDRPITNPKPKPKAKKHTKQAKMPKLKYSRTAASKPRACM